MSRPQKWTTGRHPSGVLICQRCGGSAALVAESGPDWSRRRPKSRLVCLECSRSDVLVAERFRLRLILRPITADALGGLEERR